MTLLLAALHSIQPAAAQAPRRWLADTELIGPAKSIGPTNIVATGNGITEMKLLDSSTGWAVSYHGVLRFDGRFWRPERENFTGPRNVNAVDASSASNVWVVGFDYYSGPPFASTSRYDGSRWIWYNEFVRRDGSTGPIAGSLTDVVTIGNTAWAIGHAFDQNAQGFYDSQRPLVLFFDGTAWHDRTPGEWREGELLKLSMVSATEGWAIGNFGPANNRRPAIMHLEDGAWTQEALPALPEPTAARPALVGNHQITMVSATEGWATLVAYPGSRQFCPTGRLLRYSNGAWMLTPGEAHNFQPVVLGLLPGTNRGWASLIGCPALDNHPPAQRTRFDSGTFTPDTSGGSAIVPTTYAILSEDVQWASGDGRPMRFSAESLPSDRVTGSQPGGRYFPETGHSIAGPFRQYYESHGLELGDRGTSDRESLALFGYPLTETFTEMNPDTGELFMTQYFERARMEYHPNNPEPYKVLLGRLGASSLIARDDTLVRSPEANLPPDPGCDLFVETGYTLCPPLKAFWQNNGGLAVYGYPINAARDETSRTDGQTYLTQWFERERLEYHPELRGTAYEVLLGLLGAEELRVRGYIQ
ncbi:MAG TPA: hypothetical protein VGD58_12405 [Herpetosiphonaceae bacterium]